MKTRLPPALLWLLATLTVELSASHAASTIDPANQYAYGANVGWINGQGDVSNGAVIGEYVCSGYLYAANVGWISLGNGAPTNSIHYQNLFANDFGVNHDGLGRLRGLAYGANIGWISFESQGAPAVDLKTGNLSGYVWSANCGWISLSNAIAHVRTEVLQPGLDVDGDGITDAWELGYTNTLDAFTAISDTDGDGVSDLHEHLADTSPLDPDDYLRITSYSVLFGGGDETDTLTWTSRETRCYQLGYRINLTSGTSWVDATAMLTPDPGATTTRMLTISPALTQRYFHVEAIKPLSP